MPGAAAVGDVAAAGDGVVAAVVPGAVVLLPRRR